MSESPLDSRYEELKAKFEEWDRANPEVWELFRKFTFQMIKRGFKNYSGSAIVNIVRWHTDKADVDGQSTFKVNQNYYPFYTRRFMELFPEFGDFFRTRHQSSKDKPATGLPELTPDDFPYTNEKESFDDQFKMDL